MAGNTRTSGFTEIHSKIESLRLINLGQGTRGLFRQVHHLIGRIFVGIAEVAKVGKWKDHQMAGPVRVNIQYDKIKLCPMEDKILLIAGRVVQNIAENTPARCSGSAACYIVISPRTPQYIHDSNPLLTFIY